MTMMMMTTVMMNEDDGDHPRHRNYHRDIQRCLDHYHRSIPRDDYYDDDENDDDNDDEEDDDDVDDDDHPSHAPRPCRQGVGGYIHREAQRKVWPSTV